MSAISTVDTRTEIETPENVTLTFQLAGPGSRMGAYLIDFVLRLIIGWVMIFILTSLTPIVGQGAPIGLMLVGFFLLEWGYGSLFEGLWRGQTPGKKFCGLRVIKDAGYPISFYDAVLRNLLRAADILPIGYGVGLICMSFTARLQRIGDLAAGTMVVRNQQHRFERDTSDFAQLDPIPASACFRRYAVSERTLDVIEQLLWRRETLPRRRVEELAGILAEPVARQLGYELNGGEACQNPNIYFLRRVLRTFSSTREGQAS
ncbi:MAG: RDD family protein [Rhodopirellula sp.]|nr:RDD family protein [Rhodopirellula sp.]